MEQQSTFWKTAMVYGLYIGILTTLYSVILYVIGQSQNKTLGYFPVIIYSVCIILAQIGYRDRDLSGSISYREAVGFGVAVMLFSGIISALYNLIIFKIDPSLIEQIKIAQEEAWLASGWSEEKIETSMDVASKFMTPGWMSIMGLFGAVVLGTIISLVTSIFVKRPPNKDAFEDAMEDLKIEQ